MCTLDGVSGICYEHTASEGVAVVQMLTKVIQEEINGKDLNGEDIDEPAAVDPGTEVVRLDWTLNDDVIAAINQALETFDRYANYHLLKT